MRMSTAKKRAKAHERKGLDRAIMRLVRNLNSGFLDLIPEREQRDLLGLLRARRRIS